MREMFRIFGRKLFGMRGERLGRNLLICLVVFFGLSTADYRVEIAPKILYLMTSAFSAGAMWQALSAKENVENLKHLMMLPCRERTMKLSYTAALGSYTLCTKTAMLWAVLFAVSEWSGKELAAGVLCGINAVAVAACIYPMRRRIFGFFWGGAALAAVLAASAMPFFLPMLGAHLVLAGWYLLKCADAYSFYRSASAVRPRRSGRHFLVGRYLFRYLISHKNYMVNTFVMWGIACILPVFLGRLDTMAVLPIGFAMLTLNTPICILLSCDPATERAVHFLPRGENCFLVPYGLFIFGCNLTADVIFLASWQQQIGGIGIFYVLTAVCFALLSAACSALLEWFYPLREVVIESDLWHHPRKYLVPAGMLLLAGILFLV